MHMIFLKELQNNRPSFYRQPLKCIELFILINIGTFKFHTI